MNPRLGGDGARGIKCGMYVIVDIDQPKPNTFPVEYKELAVSAHTSQQAWRNYHEQIHKVVSYT